jgi:glycerol-3-phosphate dehydrogenase
MSPPGYDVVVIGAGIVGSAIARELAGHKLSVALLEARDDVGDGTSKANTAILHTGYDAKPGTLESTMVSRGYHLLSQYATDTGIPIEPTGAILVAWDQEQLDALPSLKDKAQANGYHHCELIDTDAVYAQLPARRHDGARRVDHLHLDGQSCAGHRRCQPRCHSVDQSPR